MKICHIGHGTNAIPPTGWGAVESLIWDYKFWIEQFGHDCHIINTPNQQEILEQVRCLCPDAIHIHSEKHFPLVEKLEAPIKMVCSHSPTWLRDQHWQQMKRFVMSRYMVSPSTFLCCLSDQARQYFLRLGAPPSQILLTKNGARPDLYRMVELPLNPHRAICLGKVCGRKRQYLIQTIDCIDFVGPRGDSSFDYSRRNYLGEWLKEKLYESLTQYANLVLLSRDEAAPLVVIEALMSGLGVVVSESASANLDLRQPFIEVVPESRIDDADYVSAIIAENQRKAVAMRRAIRQYAIDVFDWKYLVRNYLLEMRKLLDKAPPQQSEGLQMMRVESCNSGQ